MAGNPTARKGQFRADFLRGMVRVPNATMLPPEVAYLMQNMRTRNAVVQRRKGAVQLGSVADYATGAITGDGTTAKYVSWPDHAVYDLGTKWAILIRAKTAGTPGGTQYLLARDVTPTSAGKKTFAVSINSSRYLGFESNLSDGTSAPLTASAASLVAAATWFTVLIVRNGASLAMYLDGHPTPVLTATISASLSQIAGAEALFGMQNYDGTTRSGAFDGLLDVVTLFRDFSDVPTLLKYTTLMEYPAPLDPRVILHSPFTYSAESGTVAKDYSSIRNNGVLTGAPTRAAGATYSETKKVTHLSVFGNPVTGKIVNIALVGGDFYLNTARAGSS